MNKKYIIIVLFGAVFFGGFMVLRNEKEETNPVTERIQSVQNDPQQSEPVLTPVPPGDTKMQSESPVVEDVPFTVQAPFGEWSDSHFQNACEEASLLMAARWSLRQPLLKDDAKKSILAVETYEEKRFGTYIDTSLADTQKILSEYLGIQSSSLKRNITKEDIARAAEDHHLVLLPADGRKLNNPHFRQPGPPRHMLVVIGYDGKSKEFITNDPGTRNGKNYRYAEDVLYSAILDYPTGDHIPTTSEAKNMLIISR